jgi:hypothetical protein
MIWFLLTVFFVVFLVNVADVVVVVVIFGSCVTSGLAATLFAGAATAAATLWEI